MASRLDLQTFLEELLESKNVYFQPPESVKMKYPAIVYAEYMAQLRTKGLKNLADHIVTTAFEGEVEVTRLFKYGEDFFIGDIVQIANEYGNEGSAYISELVISNSEEGLSIYPTFKTISK